MHWVTPTCADWGGLPSTCLGHESASSVCIEVCQNSTLRETCQISTGFDTPLFRGIDFNVDKLLADLNEMDSSLMPHLSASTNVGFLRYCGLWRAQSARWPILAGRHSLRNKRRTSPANCSWSSIRSSFRHQLGSRIPPTLSPRSARFAVSLSVREKIREKSDSITNLAYIPGRMARKGAFSWQLVLLGENPVVRENFLDSGPRSG